MSSALLFYRCYLLFISVIGKSSRLKVRFFLGGKVAALSSCSWAYSFGSLYNITYHKWRSAGVVDSLPYREKDSIFIDGFNTWQEVQVRERPEDPSHLFQWFPIYLRAIIKLRWITERRSTYHWFRWRTSFLLESTSHPNLWRLVMSCMSGCRG